MFEIKIISYVIPLYGNKKIFPYGTGLLKIDNENKKIKYEVGTDKTIIINHKKITGIITNEGSLYSPKLYFKIDDELPGNV